MKGIKMLAAACLLGGLFLLNSCDKKNETASGSFYKVRMTDATAPYSAVNVDIRSVQVIGTNGTATLSTNAGVYNVLQFSNGMDTLIASGNINVGTVTQVKLILGSNNSVELNGVTTALHIATGDDAGLTLNVNQTMQTGATASLLIDFDANQSVTAQAGGTFQFRPVLRPISADLSASASGNITGHLAASGTLAVVTATGANGSFSTGIAANGYFMIKGLAVGSYSVVVTPIFPLQPVTMTNVVVSAGSSTDIGVITF